MANLDDVIQARQRRKRRKQLIAGIVILAAVLAALVIYSNREKIFSGIEQMGSKQSNLSAETDGDFLLTVSGGVDYHAEFLNNYLFILCDKYLYIYDSDGKLLDSRQHAYSNAVMQTNHGKALTYSFNGTHFRVDNQKKMLYENQTEQPILFAVLNDNGYTAVVTESEAYACRLSVFDSNGKSVYNRDCVERLTDVSFTDNGCLFSTIGAENGELVTVVQSIYFDDSDVQWTTAPLQTLCMHIYSLKNGGAFVIGDTKAAYYDNTGAVVSVFDYPGTLLDFDFSEEHGAVLLKNEERRQSVMLLFSDEKTAPASVTFDNICKTVSIQDNTVYLLDTGRIRSYSFGGTELSALRIQDAYEKIMKNGKYFYLLGYDRIQRVNAAGD
ncbi:MAG: hypothetical protein E7496_08250 [Ruminococcus sp.]|nr:hypothetical protein [Ruminococcus sp.]